MNKIPLTAGTITNNMIQATVPTNLTQISDNQTFSVRNDIESQIGTPLMPDNTLILNSALQQANIVTVFPNPRADYFGTAQTPVTFQYQTQGYVKPQEMCLQVPIRATVTGPTASGQGSEAIATSANGRPYNFLEQGFLPSTPIKLFIEQVQVFFNDTCINPESVNSAVHIMGAQLLRNALDVETTDAADHINSLLGAPINKPIGCNGDTTISGGNPQMLRTFNYREETLYGNKTAQYSALLQRMLADLFNLGFATPNNKLPLRIPLVDIIPCLATTNMLFPPGLKIRIDMVLSNRAVEIWRNTNAQQTNASLVNSIKVSLLPPTASVDPPAIVYLSMQPTPADNQAFNNAWLRQPIMLKTTPTYVETKPLALVTNYSDATSTTFTVPIQFQQPTPFWTIIGFYNNTSSNQTAFATTPGVAADSTCVFPSDFYPFTYRNPTYESTNCRLVTYADTDINLTTLIPGTGVAPHSGHTFKLKADIVERAFRRNFNTQGKPYAESFTEMSGRLNATTGTQIAFKIMPDFNPGSYNDTAQIGIASINVTFTASTLDSKPIPSTWQMIVYRFMHGQVAISADQTCKVTTLPNYLNTGVSNTAVTTTATNLTGNSPYAQSIAGI